MMGALLAAMPVIRGTAKLVFGGLADKFQKAKIILLVAIVLQTLVFFSVNFIPEMDSHKSNVLLVDNSTKLLCDNDLRITTCSNSSLLNITLTTCRLYCDDQDTVKLNWLLCNNGSQNCLEFKKSVMTNSSSRKSRQTLMVALDSSSTTSGQASNSSSNWNCQQFRVQTLNATSDNRSIWTSNNSAICSDSDSTLSLSCSAECLAENSEYVLESTNYRFLWIWTAYLTIAATSGVILSISDANLLNILEDRSHYGFTRLFASMGWGLIFVFTAKVTDLFNEGKSQKDYSPGFYIFLAMMAFNLIVAIPMKVVITEKPKALIRDVLGVFKSLEFALFVLATLCIGMGIGIMWTYVITFIQNDLQGDQLVIGVYYAVECFVSEIPFFLVSGWVVKKLGHHYAMSLVLLMTGTKCVAYSFIYDAWYIVLVAVLHGFTYAAFYATAAPYVSILAPEGASVTMQALIQAILEGAGIRTNF